MDKASPSNVSNHDAQIVLQGLRINTRFPILPFVYRDTFQFRGTERLPYGVQLHLDDREDSEIATPFIRIRIIHSAQARKSPNFSQLIASNARSLGVRLTRFAGAATKIQQSEWAQGKVMRIDIQSYVR
jgi:hypothetical protein